MHTFKNEYAFKVARVPAKPRADGPSSHLIMAVVLRSFFLAPLLGLDLLASRSDNMTQKVGAYHANDSNC